MQQENASGSIEVKCPTYATTAYIQDSNIVILVAVILLLNLASALFFISVVKHPAYDDQYNILDVHNYVTNGFSTVALQDHRNAPGPTSFLWMAGFVHLLKGSELRDARLGALISWLLLTVGIIAGAHSGCFQKVWYGALLVSLVFPHT